MEVAMVSRPQIARRSRFDSRGQLTVIERRTYLDLIGLECETVGLSRSSTPTERGAVVPAKRPGDTSWHTPPSLNSRVLALSSWIIGTEIALYCLMALVLTHGPAEAGRTIMLVIGLACPILLLTGLRWRLFPAESPDRIGTW
jgi:hypothetical protein